MLVDDRGGVAASEPMVMTPGTSLIYAVARHARIAATIRLPAAMVDGLELNEGDDIEIEVAGERRFRVQRDQQEQTRLRGCVASVGLSRPGFQRSRDEAHER